MKLMPQEIEVRYVLPAIRKEFALVLSKKGIKQKEIAKLLNITPAAVSQYLKDKRGSTKFQKEIQKEIESSIFQIKDNPEIIHKEIFKLTHMIRETAIICDIHRMYDDVPKKCEVCFKNDN